VDKSNINIVKVHHLNHFSDHIRQLESLWNATFEYPASEMMDDKQACWQSHHHEAALEILRMIAWKEVFEYCEMNANAAKQCHNDEMPLTKASIKQLMKNLQPKIKTLDKMAVWCALRNGELQNHIAWCLKIFTNFTDYVNHHHYFSHLNEANIMWYNPLQVKVPSFDYDEQADDMSWYARSTRWRNHVLATYKQWFSGCRQVWISMFTQLQDRFSHV